MRSLCIFGAALALGLLAGGGAGAGGVPVECHLSPDVCPQGQGWARVPLRPGWWGLFRDGRQVGAWNDATGESWACEVAGEEWCLAGSHCPDREDAAKCIRLTAAPGVSGGMVAKESPGYRLNGRFVTEAEALGQLQAGPSLNDDSALPFLTLIGSPAENQGVENFLKGKLRERGLDGACLVQSYAPDNWAVARFGFERYGRPSIYMQAHDGKVLFRADGGTDRGELAEAFALAVDQCCPPRKPDPNYQPARDPEPERLLRAARGESWGWLVGLLCGAFVLVWLTAGLTAGVVLLLSRRAAAAPPAVQIVTAAPPAAPAAGS